MPRHRLSRFASPIVCLLAAALLAAGGLTPALAQQADPAPVNPSEIHPEQRFSFNFRVTYRNRAGQRTMESVIATAPDDAFLIVTDVVVQGDAGLMLFERKSAKGQPSPLFVVAAPTGPEKPTRMSYRFATPPVVKPGHQLVVNATEATFDSGQSVVSVLGYRRSVDAPRAQQMQDFGGRLDELESQFAEAQQRMEQEHDQFRKSHEQFEKAHQQIRQQIEAMTKQHREDMAEAEKLHQKLQKEHEQFAKRLDAISKQHEKDLGEADKMHQQLQKEHQQYAQRLQQLAKQHQQITAEANKVAQQQAKQVQQALSKQLTQMSKRVEQLEQHHAESSDKQ